MANRRNRSHRSAASALGSDRCSLVTPTHEEDAARGVFLRSGNPPVETETQKKESYRKARYWFRENGFVRMILLQRFAFYHFGFTVTEAGGAAIEEKWSAENLPLVRSLARDCWHEWLRQDNAPVIWRVKAGKPFVRKPEDIDYSDVFAEEILKFRHGMTHEQIDALPNLTKAEKDRLKAEPELKLTKADPMFQFEVLKRELVGDGLASTGLRPIFLAAGKQEALEVSDGLLAYACRNVYEQHKIGHEIKQGPHAGSKIHFLKKALADVIKKELRGKTGFQRLITNFDHAIQMGAGLPDPKQFAAARFEGCVDVMLMWAMPLGHLLLMKSMNPYLMEMLRVQAAAEREYLGPHLETVIARALGKKVRVSWSDRCFQDMRIFVELLKFGLQSGPVSQKTYLATMALDQEKEQAAKKAEAATSDGECTPRYDAAHGPVNKSGRPVGEGDNRK